MFIQSAKLILTVAVTLAALTSSAVAQTTPTSIAADEAAIRSARMTQTQALAKDDLDTVVKYWSPDITIRRALGHPIDGAANARKVLEPAANAAPVDPATRIIYQREAVSVEVSPNWPLAYEEGRWSGHIGNVGNKPVIGGRYSAQWVKRDGKWGIRAEVFVALTCADAGCKAAALP